MPVQAIFNTAAFFIILAMTIEIGVVSRKIWHKHKDKIQEGLVLILGFFTLIVTYLFSKDQ